MKKLLIIALMLCSASLVAQKDGVGVGIISGFPNTGLSIKKFVDKNAFDIVAAWDLSENDNDGTFFIAWIDYLFHNYMFDRQLPWYVGAGAAIGFGNNFNLGARGVLGITYIFDWPFDVFVEIGPMLELLPETETRWGGGAGFRFYIGD